MRKIFEKAENYFKKNKDKKEDRNTLIIHWLDCE